MIYSFIHLNNRSFGFFLFWKAGIDDIRDQLSEEHPDSDVRFGEIAVRFLFKSIIVHP